MTLHPRGKLIQAVVFDLDDTLYPERQYVLSGYRAVETHLCRSGAPAGLAAWMWQRFCAGQAAGMFDAVNAHFGLNLSPVRIAELVEVYRTHRPSIQPDHEALAAVHTLHGRRKLGLLSDGFLPAQRLKLEALGLAGLFDVVIFTEEMGRTCWKPSPAGFLRVAELLATEGRACAYVADNPAKDFVAPNALGWLTIRWLRPGQVHANLPFAPAGQPEVTAETSRQLLELLGEELPPAR